MLAFAMARSMKRLSDGKSVYERLRSGDLNLAGPAIITGFFKIIKPGMLGCRT
jgi:hypothetical protein